MRTKPAAPASNAPHRASSSSKVVRISDRWSVTVADPTGRLDAVDASHPDVHQDDVDVDAVERVDDLRSVSTRHCHDETGVGVQDPLQSGTYERLVVDQGDGDHEPTLVTDVEGAVRGSRATTRQPSPNGPTAKVPPSDSTALAHADETHAGRGDLCRVATSVDHRHLNRVGGDADLHDDLSAGCVLRRVREALLQDAIDGEADDSLDIVERPAHDEPHVGPSRRRRRHEVGDITSRRHGAVPVPAPSPRRIATLRRISARLRRPISSASASARSAPSGRSGRAVVPRSGGGVPRSASVPRGRAARPRSGVVRLRPPVRRGARVPPGARRRAGGSCASACSMSQPKSTPSIQ